MQVIYISNLSLPNIFRYRTNDSVQFSNKDRCSNKAEEINLLQQQFVKMNVLHLFRMLSLVNLSCMHIRVQTYDFKTGVFTKLQNINKIYKVLGQPDLNVPGHQNLRLTEPTAFPITKPLSLRGVRLVLNIKLTFITEFLKIEVFDIGYWVNLHSCISQLQL